MAGAHPKNPLPGPARKALLYHFCRVQLPFLTLSTPTFEQHLQRCYDLYRAKQTAGGSDDAWPSYLAHLYAIDWYLCCACLEGQPRAWETLFAARAGRGDFLLVDALRTRAMRLFPRDEEKQDNAVTDFWGYLLAGERPGSTPILARYDGQRPLIPWLIRVFQNKHISDLRHQKGVQPLPDDDLDSRDQLAAPEGEARWHDEFRAAASAWLEELADNDVLLLGLRLRYRLSQRQVAQLLGIHEGNVSRQTTKLRDHCLEEIGKRLVELGWTGDDLTGLVRTEMDSLLMDEPRLSADRLAALLAKKGKTMPKALEEET